ncbi:MAG: hypothetical protein SPF94_04900, partial [Desulfovibrio sp.]|nr:hypothetical protein [Desulfovibrio sp.]
MFERSAEVARCASALPAGPHPVVQVGGLSRARRRYPERKKSVFSGFWLSLGVSKGLTFHMKRGKRFSLSGGIFIMYAIIETGGKQYCVEEGSKILV